MAARGGQREQVTPPDPPARGGDTAGPRHPQPTPRRGSSFLAPGQSGRGLPAHVGCEPPEPPGQPELRSQACREEGAAGVPGVPSTSFKLMAPSPCGRQRVLTAEGAPCPPPWLRLCRAHLGP